MIFVTNLYSWYILKLYVYILHTCLFISFKRFIYCLRTRVDISASQIYNCLTMGWLCNVSRIDYTATRVCNNCLCLIYRPQDNILSFEKYTKACLYRVSLTILSYTWSKLSLEQITNLSIMYFTANVLSIY